jgi:hypothetical protein
VEFEVGHVGGFAEKIVPGFVSAFAGGWFEYPDFRFRDLKAVVSANLTEDRKSYG